MKSTVRKARSAAVLAELTKNPDVSVAELSEKHGMPKPSIYHLRKQVQQEMVKALPGVGAMERDQLRIEEQLARQDILIDKLKQRVLQLTMEVLGL